MIDHLSASQLNLYIICSLKYRFQYLDRLPRPFKSSALAFGGAVHSAIEWLHKERIKKREVTLQKLQKIFEIDWYSQRVETKIRYKEDEDEIKLLLAGKEMMNQYFNSGLNGAVSAEVPFHLPLVNPISGNLLDIPIDGVIDLVEKDATVVEFKTSARSMNQEDADKLIQPTIYSYAYELLFGEPPKTLKVINFVKSKTPKMLGFETKRDRQDQARLFNLAQELLKGITAGFFFPRSGFLCNDCEYLEPCREWEGN